MHGSDRGVSPVVSTTLLVAVVVVLAATTSVFALGLGEKVSDPAPSAVLDTEETENETVTMAHVAGETIDRETLVAKGGEINDSKIPETIEAGSTITIGPEPEAEEISLVWESEENSAILHTVESLPESIEGTAGGSFETADDLQTDNGGIFYQTEDGERFVMSEGDSFSDVFGDLDDIEDSDDGVVAYAVDNEDKTLTGVEGGSEVTLSFSEDDELDEQPGVYARTAQGLGTPQPWQGDYTLERIEETDDGVELEWESN